MSDAKRRQNFVRFTGNIDRRLANSSGGAKRVASEFRARVDACQPVQDLSRHPYLARLRIGTQSLEELVGMFQAESGDRSLSDYELAETMVQADSAAAAAVCVGVNIENQGRQTNSRKTEKQIGR